ncbi:MAG: porphobilinogen synthase [Bdellovibrionales bacterium]|nr:porphobilinogen synthase [Bdellovibrionales bacterium]MBT3526659.1 porphobilinogen synthase [Bdellovibrionales bacterium]MBT7669310.1 porphobilinogen synthase [Bdellovibrionales bacterium]MBT7766405.1 porphobilinogen synthase [Bdellovibrionales bacterium]
MELPIRARRNRKNSAIRDLIRENHLTVKDLIAPLFVIDGKGQQIPIKSMPGQARLTVDLMIEKARNLWELGIPCVSLFPALEESLKNSSATESYNPNNFYQKAIKSLKSALPELLIMTDVALDPYSSDGHDGLVDSETGEILNDQTIEILAKMAICQAQSGSDIVGPSDMMDGRVGAIRTALDQASYENVSIMAYTAKYASSFYGPFRDALDSAPKGGDKKTYQMDYANGTEALRELQLDQLEGADIMMVKPGLPYLDVIYRLKQNTTLPIAAYNVSGEYAMIKAAAQNGWLDEAGVILEMLTAFKRAGADMILTYFAEDAAKLLSGSKVSAE